MDAGTEKRINDHVRTFFESIGVDPNDVPVNGVGEYGYGLFRRAANGDRIWNGHEHIRDFHAWPNGSKDWLAFMEAAVADRSEHNSFHMIVAELEDDPTA